MEADGESSPQLWSPPTTLLIPARRRTSPLLNQEALILAIPILVLLIIFLILSPFFSYTNHQILKPSLVQKGWDYIYMFSVLIAILSGIFAKRNDDYSSSSLDGERNLVSVTDDNIRKSIASSKWLDFPDKSEYDKMTSSRSYPDLRQESLWGCESNVFKWFDDFEVNLHRQPEKLYHHRERRSQKEETEAVTEPAPPVRRRRSVHMGRNEDDRNENKSPPPPPATPSLPPPPLELEFIRPVAEKAERIQTEKGGATKAIASLQYLSAQRKKKVKTRDIYESATEDSLPPSTPPPPPPPPPPSKGFQSLLKKSSKSKRVHSVPTTAQSPPPPPPPPNSIFVNIFKTGSKIKRSQLSSASSQPPPPPPPPHSIFNNIFSSGSKSKRCQIPSASSQPPPPPPSILISSFENLTKSRRFKNYDTPTPPLPPPQPGIRPVYTGKPPKPPKPNTCSHNETAIIVPSSPLIPMPPPPPTFRTPERNFVPKGDLARKRSTNNPQRSSPELESDSGHSIRASVSCPSPDVNTKADTFISRLRDGWRLEKLNSVNERQNSVSSTSNRL